MDTAALVDEALEHHVMTNLQAHEPELCAAGVLRLPLFGPVARGTWDGRG